MPPRRHKQKRRCARRFALGLWIGVGAVALTLLLALLAQWISARTAVMLVGSLLTFALSAERLNPLG